MFLAVKSVSLNQANNAIFPVPNSAIPDFPLFNLQGCQPWHTVYKTITNWLLPSTWHILSFLVGLNNYSYFQAGIDEKHCFIFLMAPLNCLDDHDQRCDVEMQYQFKGCQVNEDKRTMDVCLKIMAIFCFQMFIWCFKPSVHHGYCVVKCHWPIYITDTFFYHCLCS